MQHFQQVQQQTKLHPGHYKFSKQFPDIMEQLALFYTVSAESVFLAHLLMNVGKLTSELLLQWEHWNDL